MDNVLSSSALKKRIFFWALKVGKDYGRRKLNGEAIPRGLQRKRNLAHKLVYSKIIEKTGGRVRFFVSGGAPLSKDIAEFFYALGLVILEGYGLTETSPVISVNTFDNMRLGTVGKPIPGVEVKIAPDGEILTRGPHVMKGYFNKPEATAEAIDAQGWFHTGDIGVIDAKGFLTITDRKKDIIVTSGGKNIAPQPIENKLKTNRFFSEVVMVGNRRNFPAALVVPNYDALAAWAKERGISGTREELVRRKEIVDYYQELVASMTGELAQFEKIKKIALLPKELTQEAGEITPTLKVKRRVVEERYKALIDDLYRGAV
jgi:long-chain acyl-CoA synthetase